MKNILQQINLLPEVIGSMIFDAEGRIISHELPPLFDLKTLQDASSIISESIEGLRETTDGVAMFDFRYQSGRIVIRSMSGGLLLLLCTPSVNMPLLNISLNVVVKKLEKLIVQKSVEIQQEIEAPKQNDQTETQTKAVPQKPKRTVAFSI